MAKGRLLLGLDIGSSSAKICQLRRSRGGYNVAVVDRETFPNDAIVDGAILDRGAVSSVIGQMLSRNKISNRQCAIAISGYSVIVKRLRLPNMTPEELQSNIRWEVEQHIPFDYADVVVDTVILNRNTTRGTMDILLVASKRDIVNDYISVAKEAGLDVKVVDVASFALQNMAETVYGETSEEDSTAIVNIGASVTSMTLVAGGVPSFTRDITMGGNLITEEIQKKLGITRDEAEAFKTGNMDNINAVIPSEVEEITRQVSETLAEEIKRSLNFFFETSGRESIENLIVCGGVIKNHTTLSVIRDRLDLPITVANPFEGMGFNENLYTRSALEDLALESAIAVGLALRTSDE